MSMDFNDAQPQRGEFDLIPDGAVAPVMINYRGEKRTNANDASMLDLEFVVTAGEYAKRKMWGYWMITSNGSKGHDTAVGITRSRVRGVLESARGIDPVDDSPAGMAGRKLDDWADLDGMVFLAKIGIEKGTGEYKDKNVVVAALTVGDEGYEHFTPKAAKPKPAPAATPDATTADDGVPAWA